MVVFRDLQTFVINLDRSPDRMVRAAAQLAMQGIRFERVPAIDGKDLSGQVTGYDPQGTQAHIGRELTPGEVGCALSHFKGLEAFIATDARYALVLEDDFVLSDGLRGKLSPIIEWLDTGYRNVAVANLASRPRFPFSPVLEVDGHQVGQAHYPPMRTTALLWTREGATRFLAENETFTAPIDIQIRHWIGSSGTGLAISPPLISFDDAGSVNWSSDQAAKRSTYRRSKNYAWIDYRRKTCENLVALISYARN